VSAVLAGVPGFAAAASSFFAGAPGLAAGAASYFTAGREWELWHQELE